MSYKQPAHSNGQESAENTVNKLREVRRDIGVPTMESSSERAKKPGNPHPVAPEDRKMAPGPMQTAPATIAAGHLAAAETAINLQADSQRRIESDPRHERDQKIFELASSGALASIPPSEAEVAANAVRSGLPPEVAEKIPKTAEEEVAQDMPRLEEAQRKHAEINKPVIEPGEQEGAPKNNLERMVGEGKQIGGAEGEAQAKEKAANEAAQSNSSNIIQ